MGENVIKITGKIGASQTFYVTGDGDYDALKNIPIINLTGTDEEPILLNTLETGLYRLNGIYRVNASEEDKMQADNRLTIVKKVSDNDIYLQMLNPQGNIVEFYHITETDTLHKKVALSNLATTQDIPIKVSELENDRKYITEEELKAFGYATEEFVKNQGYLTEETDPTVPDYVKNITETDIKNWNKEYQLPVASASTLGGVKVGDNLEITVDGTLNAVGGGDTEIKVLSGAYDNPIKLYEITEQGKYLINGYATATSEASPDSYGQNSYILIVLNVNNTIFQYIVGIFNKQLRLRYRIGVNTYFVERNIASATDTFEPYNDLLIYNGKQIGEYYGNKYQLTTTDKTSLVKAINEINAKISSGTLATNLAEVQGYDATKTQVLKNINGQFTWVSE